MISHSSGGVTSWSSNNLGHSFVTVIEVRGSPRLRRCNQSFRPAPPQLVVSEGTCSTASLCKISRILVCIGILPSRSGSQVNYVCEPIRNEDRPSGRDTINPMQGGLRIRPQIQRDSSKVFSSDERGSELSQQVCCAELKP
ncbi:hypothetical protein TKK_0005543 [Trichogramma kaykai]